MTTPEQQQQEPTEFSSLTNDLAADLIKLGFARPAEPIDALLERLRAPDADQWIDLALARVFPDAAQTARDELLAVDTSLDRLVELKERAKDFAHHHQDKPEWVMGMMAYFLVLAAALAHHRTIPSRREPGEIVAALSRTAMVVTDPWFGLIQQALTNAPR